MSDCNADESSRAYYGRALARNDDQYYENTYSDGDEPEIYAIPIYSQTERAITPSDKTGPDSHDYFILELSWDDGIGETATSEATTESATTASAEETTGHDFSKWNKIENNKETDIVFITASRVTG